MRMRWSQAHLNLGYATFSFALSFAAWGSISAVAGSFRTQFNLSHSRPPRSWRFRSCSVRWRGWRLG
jgi:hypothetical protein